MIVPFHRNASQLRACLDAIVESARGAAARDVEILVAADGAADDPADPARACNARLVAVEGPRGPATARNVAAAAATGDVLVFVDSDVVVHRDALARIVSVLGAGRDVSAVFGAYDLAPLAPGLVSQAKNLAHTFVHQGSPGNAVTFWAGLGAVRAEAFRAVGGFDERFARPSIEDIDFGYRLTDAGHRIVLDPSIRGTHLKRWTFWTALVSDLRDRGIPWTQVIQRYGGLQATLNLAHRYRLCVVLAYGLVVGAAATMAWRAVWPLPVASLVLALAIDRDYYAFMARCRGWGFALRSMPLRLGHHLANGVSFAVGNALYVARRFGLRLPGSLPLDPWTTGRPFSPRGGAGADPGGADLQGRRAPSAERVRPASPSQPPAVPSNTTRSGP